MKYTIKLGINNFRLLIMSYNIDRRPISTIENKIEGSECSSTKVYPKKNWFKYPNKKPRFIILWQCKSCKH